MPKISVPNEQYNSFSDNEQNAWISPLAHGLFLMGYVVPLKEHTNESD